MFYEAEYQRVIYKKNPLVEVVCGISFPQLLEIGIEEPVEFQKAIRSKYPILKTQNKVFFTFSQSETPHSKPEITYIFFSECERWMVSLSNNSISLSTVKYHRWEEFRTRLEEVVSIFNNIYQQSIYLRIGLRYKDIINRDNLDMKEIPWKDILSQEISNGILPTTVQGEENFDVQTIFTHPIPSGFVRVFHGVVKHQHTNEQAYLIDGDFFLEKIGEFNVETMFKLFDEFNKHAGKLFRWSISNTLHDAMEPEPT